MTVYEFVSNLALGAMIPILASHFSNRSEQRRELSERKWNLLEKVSIELAAYFEAPTTFTHIGNLFNRGKVDEQRLSPSRLASRF